MITYERRCCKNCEHYYPPICMHRIADNEWKREKVKQGDWCGKWKKDWQPSKKELKEIGFNKE